MFLQPGDDLFALSVLEASFLILEPAFAVFAAGGGGLIEVFEDVVEVDQMAALGAEGDAALSVNPSRSVADDMHFAFNGHSGLFGREGLQRGPFCGAQSDLGLRPVFHQKQQTAGADASASCAR